MFARRALTVLLMVAGLCAQSDELVRESQRAKELMIQGKYADAAVVYRDLVKALPGNPGLLLNLGLAEHMAGQPKSAIAHLGAVLKADPRNLPALLSIGAAYLELDEPQAAIDPLQKALAQDGANRQTRGLLADALLASGRPEQAAEQYRKLTEETADDPQAWVGLGRSYESLAERAFHELEVSAPDSAYRAVLVADARVERRQYRAAFALYREVLDRDPQFPGVHAGLAEVYRRTAHDDWAAIEAAREQAAALPGCAPAGAKPSPEALFLESRGCKQVARQAFEHLAALPDSAQLHEMKAMVARTRGQPLDAAAEWREAVRLAPGNPHYQEELAAAVYQAGDHKNAAAMAQSLLEKGAASARLQLLAGDSLLHLEEVDRAIPYLEKAVRSDPKLLAAHASLGLAYARAGRGAAAIPHLQAALTLDTDGSLHYQLARALQAAGQVEKSRQAMAQYQAIQKKVQAEKQDAARDVEISAPRGGGHAQP